ncbi:MAG TPA: hypothetical protein VGD57_03935, partial [Candidatus Dormibacteraeota bacterium]
ISRGSTMIQNAFTDCKRNLGQMRGAIAALRSMPQAAMTPPISDAPRESVEERQVTLLMSAVDR